MRVALHSMAYGVFIKDVLPHPRKVNKCSFGLTTPSIVSLIRTYNGGCGWCCQQTP